MPYTFQIINIKGSNTEPKRNSDGKVVFRDSSHFKVCHIRNHPLANVVMQNTESSSRAANQTTSVLDVRKRTTQTTAGKARKQLTDDILGEPVDDDTVATNQS